MNAKETMQALLDGKTLRYNKYGMDIRYRLDGEGNLLHIWKEGQEILKSWTLSGLEVYEEYPLTFEQALKEMLDSKVVEVKVSNTDLRIPHRFNREISCFEHRSTCDGEWWETHISECEQKSKWKVVE
ncbi:MAG: hypothetical protein IJV90_02700 [Candidatus Methanomethylophilaceae archaeon]|nr:hypothetical protein [Candidatus Methanomethylophilaceae archaeon]